MATITTTQNTKVEVDEEDLTKLTSLVWSDNGYGVYTKLKIHNRSKTVSMASFIMNAAGKTMYDHADRNYLNNCKSNLRVASVSQNAANRIKQSGSSKYKGVYFNKQLSKWLARVKKDGKTFYLGLFSSEKDAALAYNSKAYELFGEFAVLNKF